MMILLKKQNKRTKDNTKKKPGENDRQDLRTRVMKTR